MIYLIIGAIVLSLVDIRELKRKNRNRDIAVYIVLMLLIVGFGVFYYINPDRDSFAKIMLSLIGKER